MKRVLFVCTANVCRSPMSEAIFNAMAADAGLPLRARSVGTSALVGEGMAPNATLALEEIGIRADSRHCARQVTAAHLEDADLVLAMSPRHVADLRRTFGGLPESVGTLPDYANEVAGSEGVSDPYGHTMAAYRASVRQLLRYLDLLMARLARER